MRFIPLSSVSIIPRFLHAYLQVHALGSCTTIKEVKDAIQAFPRSIQEMYSLSVRRIKEQRPSQAALGLRVLHWLIYTEGSLKVRDMQYALAASSDTDNYTYHEDNAPQANTIVSVCCGLATIETTNQTVRLVRECPIFSQIKFAL